MAHISPRDQDVLKKEFDQLTNPVKLICFTQEFECQYCSMTREILTELSELSNKISLEIYDLVKDKEKVEQYKIDKIPATVIEGSRDYGIRYFGIPAGYEFSAIIEDIFDVSRGSTDLKGSTKDRLLELSRPIHIQIFVTPTCPYCTAAVRMAHKMAIESELVHGDMVEATEFPQLAVKHQVSSVPQIVINDSIKFVGALPEANFLAKVLEAEGTAKVTA